MENEQEQLQNIISNIAKTLEQEKIRYEEEISAKAAEIEVLKRELDIMNEQIKMLTQQNNELQEKINLLEVENNALRAETVSIRNDLERQLKEKEQIIEMTKLATEREIDEMKTAIDDERRRFQQELSMREEKIHDLEHQLKMKDEEMHKRLMESRQEYILLEKKLREERDLWKKLKDEYQMKLEQAEQTKKEALIKGIQTIEEMLEEERRRWREKLREQKPVEKETTDHSE